MLRSTSKWQEAHLALQPQQEMQPQLKLTSGLHTDSSQANRPCGEAPVREVRPTSIGDGVRTHLGLKVFEGAIDNCIDIFVLMPNLSFLL
jgi:hypothetical protein